MYTKDKKTRITLRLNQTQFDFVYSNAQVMGVTPSEWIRILLNITIAQSFQDSEATLRQRFGDQAVDQLKVELDESDKT